MFDLVIYAANDDGLHVRGGDAVDVPVGVEFAVVFLRPEVFDWHYFIASAFFRNGLPWDMASIFGVSFDSILEDMDFAKRDIFFFFIPYSSKSVSSGIGGGSTTWVTEYSFGAVRIITPT